MFKKIAYILSALVLVSLTSCGGGKLSEVETDKVITSFDQARLNATLSLKTDTTGTLSKSLWVYFVNSQYDNCKISNGTVLYNDSVLVLNESLDNAYGISNDRMNINPSDYKDTLSVKIDGSVQMSEYIRPNNYQMTEFTITNLNNENIKLNWPPINAASSYTDFMSVKFTNIANNSQDTTFNIAANLLSVGELVIPASTFTTYIDSLGYGRFLVTFMHSRNKAISTPYAVGSVLKGHFIREKIVEVNITK